VTTISLHNMNLDMHTHTHTVSYAHRVPTMIFSTVTAGKHNPYQSAHE